MVIHIVILLLVPTATTIATVIATVAAVVVATMTAIATVIWTVIATPTPMTVIETSIATVTATTTAVAATAITIVTLGVTARLRMLPNEHKVIGKTILPTTSLTRLVLLSWHFYRFWIQQPTVDMRFLSTVDCRLSTADSSLHVECRLSGTGLSVLIRASGITRSCTYMILDKGRYVGG
ncbi:hypothetical protein GGS21DRAFT_548063 [Xylaria nigripes]|nr:hypothetical protein GGS21DRAFT_548063 [Xylaria nigripes]